MLLFLFLAVAAQDSTLSPTSKISVLTCGPGNDLYSTFGHSAFRVHDPINGLDTVYNYGTFNFNPPAFYVEFAQGKLWYKLSKQQMDRFLGAYTYEKRWVKEQLLDLSLPDRNKLFQFLEKNHLPENRTYKYDFFYNNCATKIWDVLHEVYGERLHFQEDYIPTLYTFRELIHQNLKTNSWSAFGIDLALGAVIDKKATPAQHMFLPEYVQSQLEHSLLDGTSLVKQQTSLYEAQPQEPTSQFLSTPLFWILVLSLWIVLITYMNFKRNKRSRWLDVLLFLLTGLAGCLIFFLWFLTDHTATVLNFNILWAFPLNLILPIFFAKRTPWFKNYVRLLMGLLVLVIILGLFKIQVFSPLLLPLIIALGIRYFYLYLQIPKTSGP